jgi:hypothetical protein
LRHDQCHFARIPETAAVGALQYFDFSPKEVYLTFSSEVMTQESVSSNFRSFRFQCRSVWVLEPAPPYALQSADVHFNEAYLTVGLELIAQMDRAADLSAFRVQR